MSSRAKELMVQARTNQQTIEGDIICKASGRAVKCDHKVNLVHHDLGVKLTICAISATKKVCSKAGVKI